MKDLRSKLMQQLLAAVDRYFDGGDGRIDHGGVPLYGEHVAGSDNTIALLDAEGTVVERYIVTLKREDDYVAEVKKHVSETIRNTMDNRVGVPQPRFEASTLESLRNCAMAAREEAMVVGSDKIIDFVHVVDALLDKLEEKTDG